MTENQEKSFYELKWRQRRLEEKIEGIKEALSKETKDIFLSVKVSGWHDNETCAIINSDDYDVRDFLEKYVTEKEKELEDIKHQLRKL